MNSQLRNMIRRLNLSKAKPKSASIKEEVRYHRHSNGDEFDCKTLSDADDADVVWESLSSLTLQDYAMQSSSKRRSTPFMMLDQISSHSLLNDTIIKGASDATLLRIAEYFPGLLGHRGYHGRFPVHIACAYGASSDFIYKCVSLYPLTAAAQDNDGRTPFHFLCKSYANSCDDTSMSCDRNAIERRTTRILWILYRKAPSAIIIEDNHGVDVVEYALEADMSMTFIRLLQDMVARVHEHNAKKKANRKLMQARSPLLQQKDSFCMACD
ncbi:hypothetical protein QTG54_002212 [Skeletonema marinoi]|uniref:Uncharacterized protein n=1 Tax=Skeletonema marinoi TaxID=267567 RepID=A0AAD8YJ10_9STRA|nr:hypothetical protein QTG54_002212 [Skeletonema marinoi]